MPLWPTSVRQNACQARAVSWAAGGCRVGSNGAGRVFAATRSRMLLCRPSRTRAPDPVGIRLHSAAAGGRLPMPVSVANSKLIYDALKACDVRMVSALPETWLVHLIRMADEDPDMTLVRVAKEEEAVGISAGAHLAGVNSALLMQNHGFLAAINPIVSLALLYKIPLLMLISYRGHMGEKDPWQTQGGLATEPILRALNIPIWHLNT